MWPPGLCCEEACSLWPPHGVPEPGIYNACVSEVHTDMSMSVNSTWACRHGANPWLLKLCLLKLPMCTNVRSMHACVHMVTASLPSGRLSRADRLVQSMPMGPSGTRALPATPSRFCL